MVDRKTISEVRTSLSKDSRPSLLAAIVIFLLFVFVNLLGNNQKIASVIWNMVVIKECRQPFRFIPRLEDQAIDGDLFANVIDIEHKPGKIYCYSIYSGNKAQALPEDITLISSNFAFKLISKTGRQESESVESEDFFNYQASLDPNESKGGVIKFSTIESSVNSLTQIEVEESEKPDKINELPSEGGANNISSPSVSGTSSDKDSLESDIIDSGQSSGDEVYNGSETLVSQSKILSLESEYLKIILSEIINVAESRSHNIGNLSISILKLNPEGASSKCCEYAGFNDYIGRFPASLAKLFWGIQFYDKYGTDNLSRRDQDLLWKMLHESDNEAASYIIDTLSSTSEYIPEDNALWVSKRQSVNHYYTNAGFFQPFNISQKNFPIPYLGYDSPEGRELLLRGEESNPTRNVLTSAHVTRILLDIETDQAVNPDVSAEIKSQIFQDLDPQIWNDTLYNSVEGFFGEGLPAEANIYTKVGWTSFSRQEGAIIHSANGDARYILVVLGDDPSYSEDEELFPIISRLVYEKIQYLN